MTLLRKVAFHAVPSAIGALGVLAFPSSELAAQDAPEGEAMITTESGLQYVILKAGKGARRPGATDQVKVHYTGWLADGKEFDSSRKHGGPATFRLNQVISGWTEGVQLMLEGASYRFTIPWSLAYGERGQPPRIPAKANLTFEIELLSIQPEMPTFDRETATKTESGIEYLVRTEGKGSKHNGDGDIYQIIFAIYDSDGNFMDGSWRRQDAVIPPGAVDSVPCLQEIAPKMAVGSTWQLRVPNALGATRGRGGECENWVITLGKFKQATPSPEFVLPGDDDLTVTPSGLKYQVLAEGDGSAHPKMGESVTCNYSGWLTDGTPFDSSFNRGKPLEFQLGGVIKGWNEGLQLMSPGAKYLFVIPADLAYGQQPRGKVIKAGDTLVFFIELVKIGK